VGPLFFPVIKLEDSFMSEPFLAEIRIFGFNFAPRGWALCDGQILPISQNQALFSLLGTIYGGDGRTTFALPDLRGRVPIQVGSNAGSNYTLGQKGGEETYSLSNAEMPNHTHTAQGTSDMGDTPTPGGKLLADSTPSELYQGASDLVPMHAGTIGSQGANQGHENMQPFQVLNFCIALQGLFPSRN
jgi:microcystin-dependent protein